MSTTPNRPPVRWLNYPGKVYVSTARPLGPTLHGELLWPVVSTYNADLDRTRVGLSFIAPPVDEGPTMRRDVRERAA